MWGNGCCDSARCATEQVHAHPLCLHRLWKENTTARFGRPTDTTWPTDWFTQCASYFIQQQPECVRASEHEQCTRWGAEAECTELEYRWCVVCVQCRRARLLSFLLFEHWAVVPRRVIYIALGATALNELATRQCDGLDEGSDWYTDSYDDGCYCCYHLHYHTYNNYILLFYCFVLLTQLEYRSVLLGRVRIECVCSIWNYIPFGAV